MIAAILRAQLLSMRVRAGARGPSVAFSIITGIFYYGFWTFIAFAALGLFSQPSPVETHIIGLSIALFFATLYWQIAPLLTASFGASLDLRKLLFYPVPESSLFTIEVLLRVTTCAEMLIVLAGISIGLLLNPAYGLRAAPFIIGGALAFAAMNLLLSAGTRLFVERLFSLPRWKEIGFIVFLAVCIAPQYLIRHHPNAAFIRRFAPSQLIWPWAAAARFMLRDHAGFAALSALIWVAAAYSFGRRQFARSIRFDASEYARPEYETREGGLADRLFSVPARFLPDPIAAVVEKELRMLSRISRVRVVFAMSCFFGIILFLPAMTSGKHKPSGPLLDNALPIIAVYGLLMLAQLTFWNAFGFDRSATMGYFCWPVRMRDVLIGKNITVAMVLLPQITIVWAMTAVLRLPAPPGKFIEAVSVMLAASLYWFGVGNIFSVRLPRPMDPDKMNQMSGKLQALTTFLAPFLLIPIVLAYVARAILGSQLVFAGVMLVAIVLGGIVYYVCLDSAVETANRRREEMLNVLSRFDGPISTT